MTTPKPPVRLIGRDGNAFAILAACLRAARAAGWTDAETTAFLDRARAGDYDHLLRVVMWEFDALRSESGSESPSESKGAA